MKNYLVFQALKPDYDLPEEEVRDIFSLIDENRVSLYRFGIKLTFFKEGKVPISQVERTMNAVLASEAEERRSVYSVNGKNDFRSSLPATAQRDSLRMEDFDFGKSDQNKLSLHILNDLDMDKIGELKHIFEVCNIDQQDHITIEQIISCNLDFLK